MLFNLRDLVSGLTCLNDSLGAEESPLAFDTPERVVKLT